ncbi:MAG TPA: PD-(D/E)XK nuclease family protein [Candidatus Aquicultor sp.]|jgi:ATP-dependent helicase/DNAse subunit B
MPLNVIIGPARSGKKNVLFERFIDRLDDTPLLLVPSETEAISIRRELLQALNAAVGISITTYDEFLDQLAKSAEITQHRIDPIQQEFIVRRIVEDADLTSLAKSARYPGFSKALIYLFNDLKQGMNTPEKLKEAFAKWAGNSFRAANYLNDILKLYQSYLEELQNLNLLDEQLLRWEIVDALENGEFVETRPIFLYGFDDFTTSQRRIIELLSLNANITFALTFEDTDAFLGRKEAVEELVNAADSVAWTSAGLPGGDPKPVLQPNFLVAAGERGEIELVGAKILELIRKDGFKPEEIAVIMREPSRYARTLIQVFEDFALPYSLSELTPLGQSSLGRAMLALLSFCYASKDIADLVTYLRIRYINKQSEIDRFAREVRLNRIVETHEVLDLWAQVSGIGAKEINDLMAIGNFSEMVPLVRSIGSELLTCILVSNLDSSNRPDGNNAPIFTYDEKAGLKALSVIEDTLNSLGGLVSVDPKFNPDLADVYKILSSTEMRVNREAEAEKVHVLRVHRSRGRSYRAVFLLGLNEGSFPQSTSEDPFFNLEERKQLASYDLEIDTRGGDIAEERYLFYIAATRATERLFLSYQSVNSNGRALLKSSFLSDLQESIDEDDLIKLTMRRYLSDVVFNGNLVSIPSAKEAIRLAASCHSKQPNLTKTVIESIGGSHQLGGILARVPSPPARFISTGARELISNRDTFSITELESFANCPFKWYVERMLKPQAIEVELDALNKGSILHSTLEKFYRALPERFGVGKPVKDKLDDMESFLVEIFEEEFGHEAADTKSVDAKFSRHEMAENLKRFIRAEAVRSTGFTPGLFEASFGLPAEEYNNEHKQECLVLEDGTKIRGKIDRIDIDENNRAVVIDYKSRGIPSAKDIESGKSLQVSLYIEAVKKLWGLHPVAGGYLSIARINAEGMYNSDAIEKTALPLRAAKSDEEFEAILSNALEKTGEIAGRIRNGSFAPADDADCTFCELTHICRKGRA